jgi:hypothetical protein
MDEPDNHGTFFARLRPRGIQSEMGKVAALPPHLNWWLILGVMILLLSRQAGYAQDDRTTQDASSAVNGGWITGPASNPLSYLNGPAFRTSGPPTSYGFRDFRPMSLIDGKLPNWLKLEAEERFRFEGITNGALKQGNDDSYSLNRLRLQIDLQFSHLFKAVSQFQDSRPFQQNPPIGPPNENRMDLKLAYVQIGDPEITWFCFRVGRQLLNLNNTLLANSEWRNQGRSYDAVAAYMRYGRFDTAVFAASILVPQDVGISPHHEGNNVYGIYGKYDDLKLKATVNPFVLWRVQPSVSLAPSISSATGKQDMKVYGARWRGVLTESLDYSLELILERGKDGTQQIRAWAYSGGLSYQFKSTRLQPRPFWQYDIASGSGNPGDNTHRTFDTIYPTAHDRFGIMDLFGWQNLSTWRFGTTAIPHRRWTVTAQYLSFSLRDTQDALYNSSGGVAAKGFTGNGTYIGNETDAYSWYELNKHVNIGGGFGSFRAGSLLEHVSNSGSSMGPYFSVNFKDNGKSAE